MGRIKAEEEKVMKQITVGTTGITVCQNAFGALPIQRVSLDEAVAILQRAYEGGIRFFDTARAAACANWFDTPTTNVSKVYSG